MSETSLAVEVRDNGGKGVARKLRALGRVPAVLYGRKTDPVALVIDPVPLERMLRSSHAGLNTLIDLQGAASVQGKTVLVKELQRHPVRGEMIHADFYEVERDQTIVVSVPIHIEGTAVGVTMGGLLDHSLREVEVECLPNAIPDEFVVDVTPLEQGDSVHVRDLALPTGVELRSDGDLSVVSVVAPAAEEVEAVDEELEEGAEAEAAPEGAPETDSDDDNPSDD